MPESDIRRPAVVAVTLALVMDLLDTTVVNVAVPTMQAEFGTGPGITQWVVTAYLLAIAVAMPMSSWISRRLGQGRAFYAALGLFSASSALTGLAWSLPALTVFRAMQGLGGGILLPTGMALLFAAFPAAERTKASALMSVPASLAPVLGPLIGGWFVQDIGWRWVFLLNVPVAVAAMLAGKPLLHLRTGDDKAAFDTVGFLAVSGGLVLLVFGLSRAENSDGTLLVPAAMAASLVLLAMFTVRQLRRHRPLINVRLLGRRELWSSNLVFLLTSLSYGGLLFVLPMYLQGPRGMSPFSSGLVTSLHAVGILLASPFSTRFTRRWGLTAPLVAGLGMITAGDAGLALTGPDGPLWVTAGLILVAGVGFGATIIPLQTATVAGLDGLELSDGSTMVNMARLIGMALGVAAGAAVLIALTGNATPGVGFAGGFILISAAAALAVIPSLLFREPGSAPQGAARARQGA